MKFYYLNSQGDTGYFSEKDLVKAIYTAWNIDADLYLLNDGVKRLKSTNTLNDVMKESKLVFASWESNEFNSDLLEPFGYRMEDGEEFRDIVDVMSGKAVRYEWSEVKQLI
jgi:hypothetical protein